MSHPLGWGFLVAAYLIGALPFGWILCKQLKGVDIRKVGSGSTGMTNVKRVLGLKWAALTFTLDVAKGAVAVMLGRWAAGSPEGALLFGLVAIVGHCFPVYLRFHGGKGVATTLGVALAMTPLIAVSCFALWALIVAMTRYVSLGSIIAVSVFALANLAWSSLPIGIAFLLVAVFVIYTHRQNIQRLLAGGEPKFSLGNPK